MYRKKILALADLIKFSLRVYGIYECFLTRTL